MSDEPDFARLEDGLFGGPPHIGIRVLLQLDQQAERLFPADLAQGLCGRPPDVGVGRVLESFFYFGDGLLGPVDAQELQDGAPGVPGRAPEPADGPAEVERPLAGEFQEDKTADPFAGIA